MLNGILGYNVMEVCGDNIAWIIATRKWLKIHFLDFLFKRDARHMDQLRGWSGHRNPAGCAVCDLLSFRVISRLDREFPVSRSMIFGRDDLPDSPFRKCQIRRIKTGEHFGIVFIP